MKRKAVSRAIIMLLCISVFNVAFQTSRAFSQSVGVYLPVPYHSQIRYWYCGPASLEMVLDFYGPDVHQDEIAEVAGTIDWLGTSGDGLRKAAHFSRYSQRKLGYAAFEHGGFTLDELMRLIEAGYPILVCTWFDEMGRLGHFRVVVGYDDTHVTLHDPWFRPMQNMTYSEFLWYWEFSYYWGLFVSPWNVIMSIPENVKEGDTFTVTATVTYPCPPPFDIGDYPASSSSAIVTLSPELSLVPGENPTKTLGTGNLAAGGSATASWMIQAESPGTYCISVEAEGGIFSDSPPYRTKIGGFGNVSVTVSPLSPVEVIEKLIRTVETWDLGRGIQTSLISKLQAANRSLDSENQRASIGQLIAFMYEVEALRPGKLTNEKAHYLISEAQGIIDIIKE